ncbi:catabolite degradation protein [Pseudohyphozyma bogoriensis]|nr:catabolite degradation protein [Pseudohyphozyma bogoriensis]
MAQSIDLEPSPAGSGTASSSATTNGHATSNGHSNGVTSADIATSHAKERLDAMDYDGDASGFVPLYEGSDIDRREFVRLALQSLRDIGYNGTADKLQAESGFTLESNTVTEFRNGILAGRWDRVEKLLLELPTSDITDLTTVKFAIAQQKFLEALESGETKRALTILRGELAPLNHDSGRLHLLSSWIMCNSPEDLRSRAGWEGVAGNSREQLLASLQRNISPSLMIPQRRLATLLDQAKMHQRSNCLFHSSDTSISLLADCNCDPNTFPSTTTHVLEEHTDEIWRLEFSHNGKWLATAGRDKTAMLWKVNANFALDKVFSEHTDPIACLAWSPDDSILLTAAENTIKMWNTSEGKCINTLEQHQYPIGALSWLPDGKGFVSGGMDSRIWFWDLAGNMSNPLPSSPSPSRVIDLAVTPDGKRLVAVGRADLSAPPISRGGSANGSRSETPALSASIQAKHEKKISVFNIVDKKLEYEIIQPGELTSVSISADSRFAIISHAPNEIIFLNLSDGTILRRFNGHDQGQYVLQSCFGGVLQNYVLSGSEDGKVYIWHRETGNLVHVLPGHGGGSVNAVAWNHAHQGMFASASDDRTLTAARRLLVVLIAGASFIRVHAQASTTSRAQQNTPAVTSIAGNSTQSTPSTTANATLAPASSSPAPPVSTLAPASNSSSSATNTTKPHLDTKIDATFGILGGVLIVSGGATGFWGSRNRWSSFFLVGMYCGSLVCGLLILHFALVGAKDSPASTTRGLYLFASLATGAITGAGSVIFWKGAQYLCSALGGFSLALFFLAFRSDSLIRPVALRYILIVGLSALGFVLSTFKSLTTPSILVSTAAIGATSLVLGVDCFTTAGLKEFYIYNLGIKLFPAKLGGHFESTVGIQIELGVIGALFISGVAWQFKMYDVLVLKARELRRADRERMFEEEEAGRRSRLFGNADLEKWEEMYGKGAQSPASSAALLLDSPTPSSLDLARGRSREGLWLDRKRSTSTGLTTDFLPAMDFNSTPATRTTRASQGDGRNDSSPPTPTGVPPPEWQAYLTSRKLVVSSPNAPAAPPRPRMSVAATSAPRLSLSPADDNHDEDDATPLSALIKSDSALTIPPRVPRLSLPSGPLPSRPASAAFPTSTSRPNLFRDTRRNTMIDLSEPTRGTHERPTHTRQTTAERIIVGEWAKPQGSPKPAALPPAQIMDITELEEKHRKRMSSIQAPTTSRIRSEAEAATAKAAYERRQQKEAREMREREKEKFEREKESERKRRSSTTGMGPRRTSLGSLNILLDKIAPSNPASPRHSPTTLDFPSSSRQEMPRRRSLGDLLEQPPTAGDEVRRPRLSVQQRRESRKSEGLERIAAWQSHETPRASTENPTPPASNGPRKSGGKHSWLGY